MVVEYNWYAHASGTTNTNWVVLCWQTNAYILRDSKKRVGLSEPFDSNRDNLITIRAGDTYSTVSYGKWWGVHTEQVVGSGPARVSSSEKPLTSTWDADRVMPRIRAQETLAAPALMAGLPVSIGAITITNGAFSYRDQDDGRTMSGVIDVDRRDVVVGFHMTNIVDHTAQREGRALVPMSIKYEYGGTSQPAWFPHAIVRDVVIRGRKLTICRMVIHRLELGVVPLAEFDSDRFLNK